MSRLLPVLLAALAAAAAAARPATPAARLAGFQPPRSVSPRSLPAWVATAVAGVGLLALLGPRVGGPVGLAVALTGPAVLERLEPAAARREGERLVADLPLVLDLLAACLAGGASLAGAAAAVARAVPGPCGSRLQAVCDALEVGSPPAEAWQRLAADRPDDPLAAAARFLGRCAEGGTPAAAAVGRLAREARAVSAAAGERAARRVGVVAVAPLGLCFLPAFVLVGVVPVVLGLVGPLLATF